jgi:hypothetical protein
MFLGMRGTEDWVDNQRPENWRQQILYLYPNGMAPLTAILSMMGSKRVDDPRFHWWTQEQNVVSGDIDDIYTDAGLLNAYVELGAAGETLFCTIDTDADTDAVELGNRIREGHQILLRDTTNHNVDKVGKVTGVTRGGAQTVLAVRLLEDDNVVGAAPDDYNLTDCDSFKIIGNINPEGGEMPDAIALNPVEVDNYTQIFRTPLSMTRTAMKTRLRTPNDYQKAKSEALEMHSWEMELAFLWGIATERVGDNGKPERTTKGVINFIRDTIPANVDDYRQNVTYAGQTWVTGGETWLKNMLEQIFRFGAQDKLCLCGSGFLLGIDALAQTGGQMNIAPGQKFYGMEITEWRTPFGSIKMKTHPLFSYDATTRNMAVILEPKELSYKYIDDTTFFGESSSKSHSSGYGQRRIDGLNEEFLTECGLEFGLPQKCAVLTGVGLDNNL